MKCVSCGADVDPTHKCEYCGTVCEAAKDSYEGGTIHKGNLNISGSNGDYKYKILIVKGNVSVHGSNNDVTSVGKGTKVMIVTGNLNVSGSNNDVYGVSCEGDVNTSGSNNDVDI